MSADDRQFELLNLLELRRDGTADAAARAALDALLVDPDLAALALDHEEIHRLLGQALRDAGRRQAFAASVVAAARTLPTASDAPRVMDAVYATLRRRRARRPQRFALAAVFAAAVLVVVLRPWTWSDMTHDGAVAMVMGEGVRIARAGADLVVSGATHVAAGDEIIAGDANAVVDYEDQTRIILSAGGRLVLAGGAGKRLGLTSGRITAVVAPQPPDQPLRIATPHAEAQVLGTRLVLEVDSERTRLTVDAGVVRLVATDGTTADLATNDVGEARLGAPLRRRRIEPVLSQDFESGAPDAAWTAATIEPPPVGNGSRFCARGGTQVYAPRGNAVVFERSGYATYAEDLRLAFDVLVTGPVSEVRVMVWNTDQEQNYGIGLPAPEPGRWTRVEVPFSRLIPYARESAQLVAGERFAALTLLAGEVAMQRLYVDNVTIWRER